ncbi:MAG: hypothetical protein WCL18_05510 [bacterium]
MLASERLSMFCVSAEKLVERILSGSDANHPGAYAPTPTQAIENNKKYTDNNMVLFFLNFLLWTIKNVMMDSIHNTHMILIIIHEKSPSDGLIN